MLGIYEHPKVINPAEDKPLDICMPKDFSFSEDWTVVPVGVSEINFLSAIYPIIFAHHENIFAAFAILGGDRNHYLRKDGRWKVGHVPRATTVYPFGAVKDQNSNNILIFYDKLYKKAKDCEEVEFVNPLGELTDKFQNISQRVIEFYRDLEMASNLIREMHSLKLLKQTDLELKITEDEVFRIEGAVMPDPMMLLSINPEKLYDITRRGITPIVYNVASSLLNIEFIRYLKTLEQ